MDDQLKMLSLSAELATAKNKQDISASLAIYHAQAELIAPGFDSTAIGRDEIQQQLRIFFSLFPDYEVVVGQHAFNGNMMRATGQVSMTLNIPNKECPHIQLPVFIDFCFDENSITREVFYLDIGMICRATGVTSEELSAAQKYFYMETMNLT